MLEFLDQHPEAGAVGGNLVNPDGTFQSSYYSFPTLWEEFLLVSHIGRLSNPYFPSHNGYGKSVRVVDWISSASIIVRRAAIEAIDLVDEDFFIYSDETDWQYRMRQAGWKVYYLPEAITVHYGGGSFEPGGKRYTLVYRGRMLFAQKHYGRFYSFAQRTLFATAALCRAGIWSLLRASPKWQAAARKQIPSNLETLKICLCLRRPI
jgi:Predicted glycosyltransferases